MADSTIPTVPDASSGMPSHERSAPAGSKSFIATWLFALFLGGLGVDRFYLGKTVTGVLKLLTGGGFGVWSLIDVILVLAGRQTDKAGRPLAGYSLHRTRAAILTVVAYAAGWALLFAIGSSTPRTTAAAATTTVSSPASAPSPTPTASAPATPSPQATSTSPPVSTVQTEAPAPTSTANPFTAQAPAPAPQGARDAAAAILSKAGQDFSAWFEQGAAMQPSSQKIDWYTSYAAPDQVQAMQDAFSAADKNFTAEDEPASIDDWRNAATMIPGDIQTWYSSDTGQGEDPALTAKVRAEFESLAKLADRVRTGG